MLKEMNLRRAGSGLLLMTAVACSDSSGPEGALSVNFKLVGGPSAVAPAFSASLFAAPPVDGSNGTLVFTDIRLVVDEFKLEQDEGACDAAGTEGCEDFEASPHFVTIPVDGGDVGVATEQVPDGTYLELKFETKAPNGGDAESTTLLQEIQQEFADWPTEASMLIVGTFTPTGGAAVLFRVYFYAEVKVELAFDTPLVIDAGSTSQSVTVLINPDIWFINADGTVIDLSQSDFDSTGEVFDLEAKFVGGVTKIEVN